MKLFGSIKELVSAVFRKNSQEITLRPNQSTTYTASRDVQLPPGDADHALVSATSTQTLTNKTIDGDDNTVQDLPDTALKTNLTNASKFFTRDASGVPESAAKAVPAGAVVGTSDTQTLTNKTLVVASNTVTTAASGNLAATELNAALSELQSDIDTRATSSALTTHTGASSGVHGVTGSVVGTTDTQTLTNKTITSPEIDTPLIDDYAEFNEEAAPATPATGKVRMYAKTDGRFYGKDDAGTEFSMFGGGGSESITTVTSADYTVTDSDGFTTILVSTGNTNRTITLPTAADNQNRRIRIKKSDSGTGFVTVDGEGSETIDGATTYVIYSQYQSVVMQCNGTAWFIVGKVVKPRYQRKVLSASVTTNTTVSDLTFSNLIAGKAYRVTLVADFTISNTVPDLMTISAKDGGTTIATLRRYHEADLGSDDNAMLSSFSRIYVMSGTSVTFTTTGLTSNRTIAAGGSTWAELEELEDHVAYTGW